MPGGLRAAHVLHAGVMTGLEPVEEAGIARGGHGRCDPDVVEAQAQRFGLESVGQVAGDMRHRASVVDRARVLKPTESLTPRFS